MVLPKLQSKKKDQPEPGNIQYYSENESGISVSESTSHGVTNDIESTNLLDFERNHERIRCNQKFIEIIGASQLRDQKLKFERD